MNADLRHYLLFTMSSGARIVFSALSMAILARILGPTDLGRWALITAAAAFFHLLFANWYQSDAFLRLGKPEYEKTGTLEKTWGARLPMLILGILLAALVFSPVIWDRLRHFYGLEDKHGWLAFGFFISLLISIELQTFLQITRRMAQLALAPAILAAVLALFYAVLWSLSLPHYRMGIAFFGTAVLTILIWISVSWTGLRKINFHWRLIDRQRLMEVLEIAWPVLPTTLLGYLVTWGNQVLIRRSFSAREVGLYQSAFQIHSLLATLAVPFATILLPRLLDKHLEDSTITKRYVDTIAPTLFCLWLLIMFPLISVLPFCFRVIYGTSFQEGIGPLTALLAGSAFCGLGQLYTILYTVQARLGRLFGILLFMVIINFVVAWALPMDHVTIRRIATAFSLAFASAQILTFYVQHRKLGEEGIKGYVLIALAVVFGLGQYSLYSLGARILWGIIATALLALAARSMGTIDSSTLSRLFTGRLQPMGNMLTKLLVSSGGV